MERPGYMYFIKYSNRMWDEHEELYNLDMLVQLVMVNW